MDKPSISFVILTWNSERYIEKCISSILDMDFADKEIFVVDNGSRDGTREILSKYGESINAIYIGKNIGTTRSRNIAIRRCSDEFEFLCILDSDTVVNEQAFADMIKLLNRDETIGIVGPQMCNADGVLQISAKRFPTVKIKLFKACPIKAVQRMGERLEGYSFDHSSGVHTADHVISACWLMKKSVVREVGLFDEKIFYAPEDNDYCMRVRKAGYKVVYSAQSKIIHDTQRISKKKFFSYINLLHITGLIYYFFKHRYWLNAPKFESSEVIESDETAYTG